MSERTDMASTANGTPAAFDDREPRGHAVRDGHLPVTELLSDRPGANSPFGDDQTFPLPPSALIYRHPTPKS
jgi:succinate dehydrogenase / fumarate reductase iron-sulfur subunit